jgi:hypothetical protein
VTRLLQEVSGCETAIPDCHARPRHPWQLHSPRETLVTLWVIILQADLKLDCLEEVTLLFVEGVFEELLDVLAHSGCRQAVSIKA